MQTNTSFTFVAGGFDSDVALKHSPRAHAILMLSDHAKFIPLKILTIASLLSGSQDDTPLQNSQGIFTLF